MFLSVLRACFLPPAGGVPLWSAVAARWCGWVERAACGGVGGVGWL